MKTIHLVNAARYFFDEGKSLLERKDFRVFHALSALGALEIHQQGKVNLIVADLDLPDMGGDALCALFVKRAKRGLSPLFWSVVIFRQSCNAADSAVPISV